MKEPIANISFDGTEITAITKPITNESFDLFVRNNNTNYSRQSPYYVDWSPY